MRLLAACILLLVPNASAQTFQLVMVERSTPIAILLIGRYSAPGANAAHTRLPDIPPVVANSPASLAFDQQRELFVGSDQGTGSMISRFRFDPTLASFFPNGTITGNGLTACRQIAFSPQDGELFATNWSGGLVSRFRFDAAGNAVANGTLTMPDTDWQAGIAIRPTDQQLFVGARTYVRRFARQPNGSYTHIGNFASGTALHLMCFRGDELYVVDAGLAQIHRFRFDPAGNPVANGTVAAAGAAGVAFSPDGSEMFVSRNSVSTGGYHRFLYQPASDQWLAAAFVPGPPALAIATSLHWYESHGTGCAGTGNVVPTLQGHGIPRPGFTINLRTQLGLPGSFGTIMVSLQPGNVPINNCTWWQSVVVGNTSLFALDPLGRNDLAIPVPATLVPMVFHFQAFLLDPGAPNGLFSDTAGLRASPL